MIFSSVALIDRSIETFVKEQTSKSITEHNFLGTECGIGSSNQIVTSEVLITDQEAAENKAFEYLQSPLLT